MQGSAADPAEALRAGGRSASAGRARQRFRVALVVSEVALSVVLLVGAGLTFHSLLRLTSVDHGFDPDDQLTFSVVLSPRRYVDATSMTVAADRIVERLAAIPGVLKAGATTHLPLSGQNMENGFTVEGYTPPTADDIPVAGMRGITGDYFTALGARLKAGRVFTAADRAGSQPVAIVNEAFARRFWPGQDPLGRRLREAGNDPWRTVVGVIADVKHSGPALEARPEVSMPYAQLEADFLTTWSRGIYFVLRGQLPGAALAPAIRTEMARGRSRHGPERYAGDVGARVRRDVGTSIPHGPPWHVRGAGDHAGEHRCVRRALLLRHAADARDRHPRGAGRLIGGHPPHGRRPRPRARWRRPGDWPRGSRAVDPIDEDAPVRGGAAGSDPARQSSSARSWRDWPATSRPAARSASSR